MENSVTFSLSQIEEAKKRLQNFGDDRANSNNHIFKYPKGRSFVKENYSNMSLKRTFLNDCKFVDSNFGGAAVTGSKFIATEFEKCIIHGASFQCCDFIKSKLIDMEQAHLITNSNFSNSYFYKCTLSNLFFKENTIFRTVFEDCKFNNTTIRTTTLEGTAFLNCELNNVNLSNLNIDFTEFRNTRMNNVVFPFFQTPYIINLLPYLYKSDDLVWIDSENSMKGKITIDEYIKLWDYLRAYYFDLAEYFPLANLYIATGEAEMAFSCIMDGVERTIINNDFRMMKHFCRLLTSTPLFETKEAKIVYDLIEKRYEPDRLSRRDIHMYLENISEVRALLLNSDYNMQTLEILIKTNIDSTDSQRVGKFIEELNKVLNEFLDDGRAQYVEFRHNSDYTFFINCVNTIENLFPALICLYSVFGVVDKAQKFYNTALDNKIKRCTIKELTSFKKSNKDASKNDDEYEREIKELKRTLRSLKADNKELKNTNKLLLGSIVEMAHHIKGASALELDSDILFSKTKFKQESESEN